MTGRMKPWLCTAGLAASCLLACFSPNPSADTDTDTSAISTSTGGVSTGGESADTSSDATATGSESGIVPGSSSGLTSDATGGSSATEGDSTTGGDGELGSVVVLNSLVGGDPIEACVGTSARVCTGLLQPYESQVLEGVPTGETTVRVANEAGDSETQLVSFGEDAAFLGLIAVGSEGTLDSRIVSVPEDAAGAGELIVVNSLRGGAVAPLRDGPSIPQWGSEVLPAEEPRVRVQFPEYEYGVTASATDAGVWASVLVGDPAQNADDPESLAAFFVTENGAELVVQDPAVTFVAPRVRSLTGPNSVCAGQEVVVSNIAWNDVLGGFPDFVGPVPIAPGTVALSLRDGADCTGEILASDSVELLRASRSLVSFGYANSVTAYEEDFGPSSVDTEYRLLNLGVNGDSLWLILADGVTDEPIETLVANLPPNGESSTFSLELGDTIPGSDGIYFLTSGITPSGNDGEWGWPHAAGNRVWFVISDNDYLGIDITVWPWTLENV